MAISLIQSIDRKQHTASSGIEIQRKFYFEPYSAAPEVVEALQGKVVADDNGVFTRTLPARDPYIRNCYCNEARVDFADSDVMATSPTLERGADAAGNPQSLLDKLEFQRESPKSGAAGGVVTASYRPLITGLLDDAGNASQEPEAFDWLDPQFNPSFREVPWPDGLFIQPKPNVARRPVPKELGSPFRIPVSEVTIRRLLVGQPPFRGAAAAAGKINSGVFPTPGMAKTWLPEMAHGTVRFEGMRVLNRFSSAGNLWYEIEYTFSWLDFSDFPVFDALGRKSEGMQPVTWNHVFMRPAFVGFGVNEMGWYVAQKSMAPGFADFGLVWFRASAGELHTYGKFDHLFDIKQDGA